MTILTCIGSRKTPSQILTEMIKIGSFCKEHEIIVRSGHAEGADWAFEKGAQQLCIAYIPWESFNREWKSQAKKVCIDMDDKVRDIVKRYHPAPDKLSSGAWKLMTRTCYQVLGPFLDDPSNAIICWTADGLENGGTSQALRIARAYNIPIFNMFHEKHSTAEKIIE